LLHRIILDGDEERFSAEALIVLILTAALALWSGVPLWVMLLVYGCLLVIVLALESRRKENNEAAHHPPRAATHGDRPTPDWSWHRKVLLQLRRNILRQGHADKEIATEPLEPFGMHEADRATDEFDHDLALARLSHERDALSEIDAALRRIDQGNYGICEETGQPISPERLRAVPWTRFCREAEEALEKRGEFTALRIGRVETVRNRPLRTIRAPEFPVQES